MAPETIPLAWHKQTNSTHCALFLGSICLGLTGSRAPVAASIAGVDAIPPAAADAATLVSEPWYRRPAPRQVRPPTVPTSAVSTTGEGIQNRFIRFVEKTGIDNPLDGFMAAGQHAVHFTAGDLPSGLYFYRIEAGTFVATRTMMLVK